MYVDCTVFIHALAHHHGMLYKAPRRPSRDRERGGGAPPSTLIIAREVEGCHVAAPERRHVDLTPATTEEAAFSLTPFACLRAVLTEQLPEVTMLDGEDDYGEFVGTLCLLAA
ncbi:hypothetical protein DEO72_LG10g1211 [Vigna unguiculata]|uniref:Uncharacterized protein n=1 Tax=Vigna unguiculata TaxID=3917 RepID=A0A4D6N9M4_VIGUN|nr:hypothetical protein DEO72_LG10g1211 [Vigna unguiculata]